MGQVDLLTPAFLAELHNRPDVFVGHQDGGVHPRLLDVVDLHDVRHVGRIVQLDPPAVGHVDLHRKSTRLNSSHSCASPMPSSASQMNTTTLQKLHRPPASHTT